MGWRQCPRCNSHRVRVRNKNRSTPGYGCLGISMILLLCFFLFCISILVFYDGILSFQTIVLIIISSFIVVYLKNKNKTNRKAKAREKATTYLYCKDCELRFHTVDK